MTHFNSTKAALLFPLTLLSAVLATQADANWFHDSNAIINRNVGSAPNRGQHDIADYPPLSRVLKEQGKVGLNVALTESGTVSDVVVEHSSGFPRLDDAAVRYMKSNWHYQPADKDKPMPATVQADVTFKLQ